MKHIDVICFRGGPFDGRTWRFESEVDREAEYQAGLTFGAEEIMVHQRSMDEETSCADRYCCAGALTSWEDAGEGQRVELTIHWYGHHGLTVMTNGYLRGNRMVAYEQFQGRNLFDEMEALKASVRPPVETPPPATSGAE